MRNIFNEIIKKEREFVENIRLRNEKYAAHKETDESLEKLNKIAKGFDTLFKDERHPCLTDFFQELRKEFYKDLYLTALNSKKIEAEVFEMARTAAKIELLDRLQYEPEAIVEHLKKRNKGTDTGSNLM